jgi:hypothetical protein
MKSNTSRLEDFARVELCNMVLGEKIGTGAYRDVYANALDPELVVKVEMQKGSFANILEWEFWQHNRHEPSVRKFLAPCVHISDSGLVLIQRRTYPLSSKKSLPKKVPSIIDDVHEGNWGHLGFGGPVVCHDYGNLNLSQKGRDKNTIRQMAWATRTPKS